MIDPMNFEFDDAGVFHLGGFDGWREAICPICEQPIRWVLDMFSFLSLDKGTYRLAHARCAWTPEAFDVEKAKTQEGWPNE